MLGPTQDLNSRYRILSLDGGGSKGIYTLGVLCELESALGRPLYEHFDLVYGTSTGAIIAAMLSCGNSAAATKDKYLELAPKVMGNHSGRARTDALLTEATQIFGEATFESFKVNVGFVATNAHDKTPMVFKSSPEQAITRKPSFKPGFGCTVVQAIMASTAAYPLFEKQVVRTEHHGEVEVIDGGFVANNPTLLALADATQISGVSPERIDILSVGVGEYIEPRKSLYARVVFSLPSVQLVQIQLETSSATCEILRKVFFKDIPCVRVNDAYLDKRYATDMLESDPDKLKKMFALGGQSYGKQEDAIKKMIIGVK
jgi:predicted acylesterase/phospholipase RssA